MTKRLILVAGNIGAGKTSLAEKLAERLDWQVSYESVVDNPYLAKFYEDMAAWAFHLQIFFLGHRAEQHLAAAADPGSTILDRSIYEDFHIFARAQQRMQGVDGNDFNTYKRVFKLVVDNLPAPDLLIYLKCPIDVLLERIKERGRAMEKGITADYLSLLDILYAEWLAGYELSPVLTIHTNDLNFVEQPDHLDIVIQRINQTLAGKEEVIFTET
jgi:deoxyadenosine/deoxycytidine kinase